MKNRKYIIGGIVIAGLVYVGYLIRKEFKRAQDDLTPPGAPKEVTTNDGIPETDIVKYMDSIRANNEWMKEIERKAIEATRSVDTQLRMDAIFMLKGGK